MQRQNQGRILSNAQAVRRHRNPLPGEPVDLLDQRARIEHDTIADDRQLAWPHHPGWQQRQLVGGTIDDERMTRVVAALKAYHDVGLLREPVDNLPLPFVSPLGADYDHIGHELSFRRVARNDRNSAVDYPSSGPPGIIGSYRRRQGGMGAKHDPQAADTGSRPSPWLGKQSRPDESEH